MKDQHCVQCGVEIMSDAPEGLCPKCLMKAGLSVVSSELSFEETVIDRSRTTDGAPRTADTSQIPNPLGRYFGDYELLEEIARGGMGVVYKARQVSLDRTVAVKMILSAQLASEAEVKRFRTEAEAAGQLQHPNIVAIHEVGEHEGRHYFSMEFVEGRDLGELCHFKPLPPERAARYVKTIVEAIAYAHGKGVLHRDLKPSNVLIDASDQPRVTDFGLAKRIEEESGLTLSGTIMGSPSYMPPEQASGRHREVGPQSDVYSLGAILYYLLTGRPPFQAATPLETMRQVLESEPATPKWVNSNVPEDLNTLCLKCLEKESKSRYATARELANDLNRFLRNEPVIARPVSVWHRTKKWMQRKPTLAGLVFVCLAAVLMALVGLAGHNAQLNERLWQSLIEQAGTERSANRRENSLELLSRAAEIKRDLGLQDQAIQTLAMPGFRLLHDFPFGSIKKVDVSHDGGLLLVSGLVPEEKEGGLIDLPRVRVFDLESGQWISETDWEPSMGYSAVSPTQDIVAVPKTEQDLALWETRTGRVLVELPMGGTPLFSADGKLLAVANTNEIQVFEVPSGRQITHREGGTLIMFGAPEDLLVRSGGRVVRWNLENGEESSVRSNGERVLSVGSHARLAAVRSAAAGAEAPSLSLYDPAAGTNRLELPNFGNLGPTWPMRFSPDGRWLAFEDPVQADSIRIWDLTGRRFLRSLSKPGLSLIHRSLGYSIPMENERGLVDFKTSLQLDAASPFAVHSAAFSNVGSLFAAEAVVGDRQVSIWDVSQGSEVFAVANVSQPSWSADGQYLIGVGSGMYEYAPNRRMGGLNVAVKLWQLTYGTPRYQLPSAIRSIQFRPDGKRLAANGSLWKVEDLASGLALRRLEEGDEGGYIFFSREGSVWSTSRKQQLGTEPIRLIRTTPDRKEIVLPKTELYSSIAVNPDATKLVVAHSQFRGTNAVANGVDRRFQLWDLETAKQLAVWDQPGRGWMGGSTVFSPDGRRIASAAFVHTGVEILDASTGEQLHHLNDKNTLIQKEISFFERIFGRSKPIIIEHFVKPIRFTPKGRYVVAGTEEGVIDIHDVASGREVATWHGHDGKVHALAIDANGSWIASGGEDRMVHLWELPTLRELARWEAHDSEVTALAFSPSGNTIASGSREGVLKLWHLPSMRRELGKLELDW